MHCIATTWAEHHTVIAITAAWIYSPAMSTQPPLTSNAGYYVRWLHDFAQALGANLNRMKE